MVIAVVVGDSGHETGVDMQCLSGQRLAVEVETAAELRGEMLGVGSTATIAGKPDLATAS